MSPSDLAGAYQWNYRSQTPRRPDWFRQWPGGNRIAVTINIMHEWESAPGARTVRKRPMITDAERTDFLALGAREYGANFGFQRLLEVLDRCGVEATVITSGLVAELFTDTTTAIPMFPTSSMRMATGWCPWVTCGLPIRITIS